MGQVIPSYQNRQISALAVTSVASQSFLLLLFLFLLLLRLPLLVHLSSFLFVCLLQNQSPRRSLAGPSQVGSLFSLRIIHIQKKFDPRLVNTGKPPCGSLVRLGILDILKKALWPQETHTFEGGSQYSLGQSVNSQVVHFCRFGTFFFHKNVDILECPSRVLGSTPVFVGEKCTF